MAKRNTKATAAQAVVVPTLKQSRNAYGVALVQNMRAMARMHYEGDEAESFIAELERTLRSEAGLKQFSDCIDVMMRNEGYALGDEDLGLLELGLDSLPELNAAEAVRAVVDATLELTIWDKTHGLTPAKAKTKTAEMREQFASAEGQLKVASLVASYTELMKSKEYLETIIQAQAFSTEGKSAEELVAESQVRAGEMVAEILAAVQTGIAEAVTDEAALVRLEQLEAEVNQQAVEIAELREQVHMPESAAVEVAPVAVEELLDAVVEQMKLYGHSPRIVEGGREAPFSVLVGATGVEYSLHVSGSEFYFVAHQDGKLMDLVKVFYRYPRTGDDWVTWAVEGLSLWVAMDFDEAVSAEFEDMMDIAA